MKNNARYDVSLLEYILYVSIYWRGLVLNSESLVYASTIPNMKIIQISKNLLEKYLGGDNLVIMSEVKELKIRKYYLQSRLEMAWRRNVLVSQIKYDVYQRHITSDIIFKKLYLNI